MRTPTVHLNGTSRKALVDQQLTAYKALDAALDALCAAAPHGRDYYPQGEDAYREARTEHEARIARVRSVMEELMALAIEIQG